MAKPKTTRKYRRVKFSRDFVLFPFNLANFAGFAILDLMNKELATVAIIGRPNVGKSTLFNLFLGERKSIVSSIAGTTRDNLIEKVNSNPRTHRGKFNFFLVDTAGLTNEKGDSLEEEIQKQSELAQENADLILFLVDGRKDLTADDYAIAEKLRKNRQVPVIFCANKVDDATLQNWDLMKLGLGEPIIISAKNRVGLDELTAEIEEKLTLAGFPTAQEIFAENEQENAIKIAFVGRPNVGKSSLMNKLTNKKLSVVSNISGTTRDTIDTEFEDEEGQKYILLDTAGLRRAGKIGKRLEYWSAVRTARAIERSDVCVLMLDALDGVTHQDLVIAGKILKAGKGIIIAVNKFDLALEKSRGKEETDSREIPEIKMWAEKIEVIRDRFLNYLAQKIRFLSWAPVLFISAKTGQGIEDIFTSAKGIFAERQKHIPTSRLNKVIPEIVHSHVLPAVGTKRGKIKFVTQADSVPPKFIFHVNNAKAFHATYRRYLENKLREKFGFHGTPIRLEFRDAMDEFKGQKKKK